MRLLWLFSGLFSYMACAPASPFHKLSGRSLSWLVNLQSSLLVYLFLQGKSCPTEAFTGHDAGVLLLSLVAQIAFFAACGLAQAAGSPGWEL